jgi:hypothetical protein
VYEHKKYLGAVSVLYYFGFCGLGGALLQVFVYEMLGFGVFAFCFMSWKCGVIWLFVRAKTRAVTA